MKKKRGLKTQLIVTSLVLTCFLSSFSFVRAAYAFSPHYFSYTHGSVSIGTYIEEASNATATSFDIATVCDFDFDAYYSGTVTLKWTHSTSNYQQHLTEWSIIAVGAKIDSLSSGQVVFRVYDQKHFQVILHYFTGPLASTPSDDPGFDFTSATSSLTAVTNHNSEYDNINSIDTKLSTTNSTLSTISSRLQTANGYFVDILQNTNDIESYMAQQFNGQYDSDVENLLNSINTTSSTAAGNISDCENLLSQIQTQINLMHSALGDPANNQSDVITCINNIVGYQHDLESTVSDIYDEIAQMSSTLNTISSTLNSILSTVQNIDNLIDTISWNSMNSTVLWGTTPDFQNTSSNAIATNTYKKLYFYINGDENLYVNRIYRFQLGINSNSNLYGITVKPYGVVVGGRVYQKEFNTYIQYFKNSTEIFVYPDNDLSLSSGSYFMFEVETTNFIRYATTPNLIGYLPSDDIEYWQLLSFFKDIDQYNQVNQFNQSLYSKLNDIIDAINGISISDQDITNITDNFDNDIETIHNIENDYGINFDSWDDQVTSSDISLDLTSYNDTVNLFKTKITSLWASPFIYLPILFSVLCFVFLTILG